jgi:hypothetical protein
MYLTCKVMYFTCDLHCNNRTRSLACLKGARADRREASPCARCAGGRRRDRGPARVILGEHPRARAAAAPFQWKSRGGIFSAWGCQLVSDVSRGIRLQPIAELLLVFAALFGDDLRKTRLTWRHPITAMPRLPRNAAKSGARAPYQLRSARTARRTRHHRE